MKFFISMMTVVLILQSSDGRAEIPAINSNVRSISVREGTQLFPGSCFLSPDTKPDRYLVYLGSEETSRVTFITDVDSISFEIEKGMEKDFIILWEGKACLTRVIGQRLIPAAVFNQAYQDENRNKISIEIPEVYEMVNIALAMTSFADSNQFGFHQESRYYSRVNEWFGGYSKHQFVASLDSVLTLYSGNFHNFRMNGYSFEFDENSKIVRSEIFNRTSKS